jgi:uncharacterized membrane protein
MDESSVESKSKKKSRRVAEFVGDLIVSMIFPFMALWFGPRYILRGEYIKGIAILVIVSVEFILALKWQGLL